MSPSAAFFSVCVIPHSKKKKKKKKEPFDKEVDSYRVLKGPDCA